VGFPSRLLTGARALHFLVGTAQHFLIGIHIVTLVVALALVGCGEKGPLERFKGTQAQTMTPTGRSSPTLRVLPLTARASLTRRMAATRTGSM
jgi:hypothetical protein